MFYRSINWGWYLFVFVWVVSLVLTILHPHDSLISYSAEIFLVFAFGITVRKYYHYRKELRFLREFHHLSQIMDDIRVLDSKDPFSHILEAIVRIVGFDKAVLFLKDDDGEIVRAVSAFNLDESIRLQMVIPRSSRPSAAWRVMETSEAVIINTPVQHPEVNQKLLELMKSSSLALVPISRGGKSLGLLMVDRHLRDSTISDDDLLQLQVLADQVSIALLNHSLHEEISRKADLLEKQNIKFHQELQLAKIVQEGVLPRESPNWKGLSFATYFKPARFIGGDFFSFLEGCQRGKATCPNPSCHATCASSIHGVLIGDVCGKGIPAALIMAVINSLFREKVFYYFDPSVIMTQVNLSLKTYLGAESRFNSSAFLGFYLPEKRKFVFANAGHDFPIFYRKRTKEFIPLESTGTLLGIFRESQYSTHELDLEPGDRILLFTDGLTDFFERKKNFEDGVEGIRKFLEENLDCDSATLIERLGSILVLPEEEAFDDITGVIMVVES